MVTKRPRRVRDVIAPGSIRNGRVIGIDPGTRHSAFVILEPDGRILNSGDVENVELCRLCRAWTERQGPASTYLFGRSDKGIEHYIPPQLAIEYVQEQGRPLGQDTVDTVAWIGRFIESWLHLDTLTYTLVLPSMIREHVAHYGANKAEKRAALLDLYGGKEQALGRVKCRYCKGKGWRGRGRPPCEECNATGWEVPPGPLADITGHEWSALAVAITLRDLGHGCGFDLDGEVPF